jgi:peptidyl-prolyl cis-trans isomerase SurA
MDELERKARDSSPRDLEDYVSRQSAELITDKIAEMLLYQKAKLRLTQPMEKKIDDYVDAELRKRVTANYDGIQRRMERELEQQGWSLDGYRAHVRRSIIISTYLEMSRPGRRSTPPNFRSLGGRRDPAPAPRRSMSLIDVRISEFLPAGESAAPDKIAEARNLAKAHITQAQSELRNGLPFADAARKYSHGSKAVDGGAWGFVNPDSVQERFAPALGKLQTLQPGQVSDVVETPDGFFLVRCDELDPGANPEFQSIQPQLREQLFARAYNKKIAELVMELRKHARIEPENLEPFHAAVVAEVLGKAKALSASAKQ